MAIARILEKQNRTQEAREWYDRGIRAWPDDEAVRHAHMAFAEEYGNKNAEFLPPQSKASDGSMP